MKFWLVIWLYSNGIFYQGDTMNGWASVPYPTKEICESRAEFWRLMPPPDPKFPYIHYQCIEGLAPPTPVEHPGS